MGKPYFCMTGVLIRGDLDTKRQQGCTHTGTRGSKRVTICESGREGSGEANLADTSVLGFQL